MMSDSKFYMPEENFNFSKNEEKVLKYWDDINAFHTQLEKTKHFPQYTFYDGPPFATGLPHYGHITAGTIKDVVTRFWTQNGRYCERRFGWDCHGLPIECLINSELGIKTKKDLLEYGVEKYNKACRDSVMKYADEWEWYTKRFGRWIDFQNDYKTMDKSFMESVWWVFKQIFQKGLVYRKCKVMPYSWACNTVLSNFEAGQNYKDINDPSIYVTFPLVDQPHKAFLAWTTTPWTLPSNLALSVNPKLTYITVKSQTTGEEFIVAEKLIEKISKTVPALNKYEKIDSCLGKDLQNTPYVPLFDTFIKYREQGCFKVLCADFVTSEDGTGIVHTAPAFGQDDYKTAVDNEIIDQDKPLDPIDEDGNFTSDFPLVQGMNFKDADAVIIEELKKNKRLLHKGAFIHSYPMCYRTGKPLMYKAIPSWFINVTQVKEDLIKNNKKAYWVPKYVQEKRFHNWLEDAIDWCFSRNRCWGNPIPIWISDDMEEMVCVESAEELCKLAGIDKIEDLHKESIDHITIPSQKGKGNLKRIPEVFDCWFESGSMPYAQLGYPHKMSHDDFMKRFPAEFIAEGSDQTRGWFYTLNVISTILFNTNPYQNLIVNGIVLNKDGKKMSKRDKNYPDPLEILKSFGADSVRLYLINSQLVRGQSLKFKEEGLKDIVKDIFLPLYNSYKFLMQNILRFEKVTSKQFKHDHSFINENFQKMNLTDKWIMAYIQRLNTYVRDEMQGYRLYTVVSELLSFLEKLSNWYIRLNRSRIKGDFGNAEAEISLNVLFSVTLHLSILLSPFIPFLTEEIYQNLKNGMSNPESSIHFLQIPTPDKSLINPQIETTIKDMISVIELGRYVRDTKKILLKKPVAKIQIISSDQEFLDNIKTVENYVIDELNTIEIEYVVEEEKYIVVSAKPNFDQLYKTVKQIKEQMMEENRQKDPILIKEEEVAKKEANEIAKLINKNLDDKILKTIIREGKAQVSGFTINKEWVIVEKKFLKQFDKDKDYHNATNQDCGMRLSTQVNDQIMSQYYSREISNRIQKLRKESGIQVTDDIFVVYSINEDKKLKQVLESHIESIVKILKCPLESKLPSDEYKIFAENEYDIADEKMKISIYKK